MNISLFTFTVTLCIEILATLILSAFFWSFIKEETDKKFKILWISLASLFTLAPVIQIYIYFLESSWEIFMK